MGEMYSLGGGKFVVTPKGRAKLAAAMPVRHVEGGTYIVGECFVERVAQNMWYITSGEGFLLTTRLYGNEACLAARLASFGCSGLEPARAIDVNE